MASKNVSVRLLSGKEQCGDGYSNSEDDKETDNTDPYTSSQYGMRGEYSNTHIVEAEIKYGNKVVGSMNGNLLERPYRAFQAACDCQSAELQGIGNLFFTDNGKSSVKSIREAELPNSKNWKRLPFLHISSFRISRNRPWEPYVPPSDLLLTSFFNLGRKYTGSLSVAMHHIVSYIVDDSRTLGRLQRTCKTYRKCECESLEKQRKGFLMAHGLQHLLRNTALARYWGVAIYIPDWLQGEGAWRKANGIAEYGADLNDEQEAERQGVIQVAEKVDACGFLRSGFQQVKDTEIIEGTLCSYLFAVPSFVENPILSHSEAMAISFKKSKPRPPPLKFKNKELFEHVQEKVFDIMEQDAQIEALEKAVKSFVAKGAEVSKIPLLHLYVAHGRSKFVPILLTMGVDVNLLDSSGHTALQVACDMFGGDPNSVTKDFLKYQKNCCEYRQCIELLVEAGANVTTTSPMGLSALGMYWSRRKDTLQFRKTMSAVAYYHKEEQATQEMADAFVTKLLSTPPGLLGKGGKVPNEVDQPYMDYDPFAAYSSSEVEEDHEDELDDNGDY